jgi:DNA gyrase subunit A
VSPKAGDAVAVVARSVEAREDEENGEDNGEGDGGENGEAPVQPATTDVAESSDEGTSATIDVTEPAPEPDGESEG